MVALRGCGPASAEMSCGGMAPVGAEFGNAAGRSQRGQAWRRDGVQASTSTAASRVLERRAVAAGRRSARAGARFVVLVGVVLGNLGPARCAVRRRSGQRKKNPASIAGALTYRLGKIDERLELTNDLVVRTITITMPCITKWAAN